MFSPSKVDMNPSLASRRDRLKTATVRSNKLVEHAYMSDADAMSETKSTLDIYSRKYFVNAAANTTLSVKDLTVDRHNAEKVFANSKKNRRCFSVRGYRAPKGEM